MEGVMVKSVTAMGCVSWCFDNVRMRHKHVTAEKFPIQLANSTKTMQDMVLDGCM